MLSGFAWALCFSIRAGLLTVCDLPPGYHVSKRGDIVTIYPSSITDPPLFTITACRSPTMQRAATSVVIRCGSIVGGV